MKLSILALTAVYAQDEPTSLLWPAQAPWSERMWCGSQTTLEVLANHTCTITLNKGKAAWLNAGGAFFGSAGTQDTFTIHTYSDTMQIPFTVFYEMTVNDELAAIEKIPFNQWGQPAYPAEWQADCFLKRDQKVQDPADIACTDNGGTVEGVFMMGFTYNNNGAGFQNVQVQNTDGHTAGSKYKLTFHSRAYFNGGDEPAINGTTATTGANATVAVTDSNVIEVTLIEDYNGELLPISFEYANELENFDPYQAAWSDVTVA